MKEKRFIQQNEAKWAELETMLSEKQVDPDRLSELYVEVTDDLSYAKTYYPYRLVRAYLNNISQKIYQSVYKNKPKELFKVSEFWVKSLPLSIWHARKSFYLALFVYILGMTIGIVSCLNDDGFAAKILSQEYVDMTLENIKKNDPMAVYKDEDALAMFLRIAWNNLNVAFRIFFSGIIFGIGALFYLMQNSIMVGTFQFFFFNKGVFLESAITIWQHGTIEISCLIISAAAGLVLGQGMLFPGSYPRMQALRLSAVKGMRIMAGITPLIILAAIIESFITRLTDIHIIFRILVLVFSAIIIVFYFVILPYKVAKNAGFPDEINEQPILKTEKHFTELRITKNAGTILMDTFQMLQKISLKAWILLLIISAGAGAFLSYYINGDYFDMYGLMSGGSESMIFWQTFVNMVLFSEFFEAFEYSSNMIEIVIMGIFVFMCYLLPYLFFNNNTLKDTSVITNEYKQPKNFAIMVVFSALTVLPILLNNNFGWLIFFFIFSIFSFCIAAIAIHDNNFTQAITLYFRQFAQSFGLLILAMIILFTMLSLCAGIAFMILLEFFKSSFVLSPTEGKQFFDCFTFTAAFFVFSVGLMVISNSMYLLYFSKYESMTADYLTEKIHKNFPLS